MTVQTPIHMTHEQVFPAGAYVTGEVEPVRDFDAKGSAPVQKRDKLTGLPMWQVSVHDADPDARGAGEVGEGRGAGRAAAGAAADDRTGLPFRPVEFDGLTVTPYVAESAAAVRGWPTRSAPGSCAPRPAGRPAKAAAAGAAELEPTPGRYRLGHPAAPASPTHPQHGAEEGPVTVQRARDRAKNTRTAPKQRLRDWLTVDRPPMVRTQRRDPGGWRTETYGPLRRWARSGIAGSATAPHGGPDERPGRHRRRG